MKRSNEKENEGLSCESHNKKIKKENEFEIIKEKFNCSNFYIDKSLLIKEFLEDLDVICVTRPSNYGKTTNLVMLNNFFCMNYEKEENEKNKKFFEKLNIGKEFKEVNGEKKSYIDLYLGKYPVVFINFKELAVESTYDKTINNFKILIKNLYNEYRNVNIDNLKYAKKAWENYQEGYELSEGDLKNSIWFLCENLKFLFNQQIILLIDNYDSPIINSFDKEFYEKFYSFYKEVLMFLFYNNTRKHYLFKAFITGTFRISFFDNSIINNYSINDSKYNEYYNVTDSELKKILFELKIENTIDKFENYCSTYSYVNSTAINNTNIFISLSFYPDPPLLSTTTTTTTTTNTNNNNNNNNINNSNNNNIVKYYDLFYVKNCIQSIKIYPYEFENSDCLKIIQNIFKPFENFNYFLFKDMNSLFQKGYIEKELLDIDISEKDNVNNNLDFIVLALLVESGYLINDPADKKLKLRNKTMENFIKKWYYEWKKKKFLIYKNVINYFIYNYDEEKIQEFLENSIENDIYINHSFLDKYYNLIVSLLSLDDTKVVITKNNFNEKVDVRELLVVDKEFLNIYNENEDKISDENSRIIYITIKNVHSMVGLYDACILALDDNKNFEFNGRILKNLYNKIIKFGIACCNVNCNVIYDINYGVHFKREEMPKIVYSDDKFNDLNGNSYFFIDKTRMISKLIENKKSIYLITRPRRFGKSLNLTMIKEFFEKPDNSNVINGGNDLFDGLEVSKNRINMREFHKYPVIYLNLKRDKSENYESTVSFLRNKISDLFKYYSKRINVNKLEDEQMQKKWAMIENGSEDESKLIESIKFF